MSKKTMIILGGSIIGIFILLILIIWLMTLFKKHYYSYEEVEGKMVEATDEFYKKNPEILPVNDGTSTLSYSTLVSNELIKPLNELLKDGDECSAEVTVVKNGDNYKYIPRLNCSDKYSSLLLYEKILRDNPVVTEGSGLYEQVVTKETPVETTPTEDGQVPETTNVISSEEKSYYFRGKITNNYVVLGKKGTGKNVKDIVWRIVGIDKDNNIVMKATTKAPDRVKFDNRYNVNKKDYCGYNEFDTSSFKDYLIELEKEESFLTEKEKSVLVKTNICVGKRDKEATVNDGSIECAVMSKDQYMFRPLAAYEIIRASIDTNCSKISDRSCSNFNFLTNYEETNEWTSTPYSEDTYQMYYYTGMTFDLSKASIAKSLFVTVSVDSYTKYVSGSGTENDPYVLINSK